MASELYRQSAFLKIVKKHGGFGWKTTSPTVAGLPDLTILLPKQNVILAEVKQIPSINRKVKITKLQLRMQERIRNTESWVIPMILIWVEDEKTYYMCRKLNDDGKIPTCAVLFNQRTDDLINKIHKYKNWEWEC